MRKVALTIATTLLATTSFAAVSQAATVILDPTGRGWIEQTGGDNGVSATNNYIVGNCGAGDCNDGEFRNHFAYDIPVFLPGQVLTGVVFKFDAGNIKDEQASSLEVQFTSTTSIASFSDLGVGTAYGSQVFTGADDNVVFDLTFNAAAIADITAAAGGQFLLSGRVISPTLFGATQPNQFAAGTTSGSDITQLELTFTDVAGGIPEPATWAMMIIGFGAIGASMRRRKKVAVTYA